MCELADARWRPDFSLYRIVCAPLHTNKTHRIGEVREAAIPEDVNIAGCGWQGECAHRIRARKATNFPIRCDHRYIEAPACRTGSEPCSNVNNSRNDATRGRGCATGDAVRHVALVVGQPQRRAKRPRTQQVFDTNVFSIVRITYAFLPLLEKSDAPVIVNVSSGLGLVRVRA